MKNGWLVVFIFITMACGSKQKSKPTDKIPVDSSTIKSKLRVDKSYLKKRPEEFREFFMLTDVIPFSGRVATKKDVNSKAAVFKMDSKNDPSHQALNIRLPFFAFLIQPNNQPGKFVVIMQAETLRGDTILGYKAPNGLYGICKPRELEYFESQKATVYQTPN
jgi:hypothetical protein